MAYRIANVNYPCGETPAYLYSFSVKSIHTDILHFIPCLPLSPNDQNIICQIRIIITLNTVSP